MEGESSDGGWEQPWYIAYHDSHRKTPLSMADIDHANNCNYDMLTSPITTDHFHSRVLALLAAHGGELQSLCPVVPPLTYLDSNLTPDKVAPQVLAYTSPWIDLGSPDPLISGISLQVLKLEVAYAAFCGVENVIVTGPKSSPNPGMPFGDALFARGVQEALSLASHVNFSVAVHMVQHSAVDGEFEMGDLTEHVRDEYLPSRSTRGTTSNQTQPSGGELSDAFGKWDSWNMIRSFCNYNARLSVVLRVPSNEILTTFSKSVLTRLQCRWYSEPVRAISFVRSSFVEAAKQGAPALSFPIQSLLSRIVRARNSPWFILQDVEPLPPPEDVTVDENGILKVKGFKNKVFPYLKSPTPAEAVSNLPRDSPIPKWPFQHLDYLRYLQQRQPPRTVVERYGAGYQDYLQVPLQPLTHNLESMTYEVFEKDPVKYELYEEAIRKALRDWKQNKAPVSGQNGRIVVAVAGAGRGPLVNRALKASREENIPIEMWAVEKNPNAFVFLQRTNREAWDGVVNLEHSDMRAWKGPWRHRSPANGTKNHNAHSKHTEDNSTAGAAQTYYSVDILISELLGSFADNELSPECLDGILHLLAPSGISIPRSYTAFMTPIAAPKLHADILARTSWDAAAPETPSVVLLHAIDYLSEVETLSNKKVSPLQGTVVDSPVTPLIRPAWHFEHKPMSTKQPLPVSNAHNTRFAHMTFDISHRAACHGLAGYFESVLYPGVELSTHPITMEQKSSMMISWFPIFFPLKTPIYIPDNANLAVSLWRKTDDRKVWYEWLAETWSQEPSPQNHFRRLGMSEIHSSIKNGCLM